MAKTTVKASTVEIKNGELNITAPLLSKAVKSSTGKSMNVIGRTFLEVPHKDKVIKIQVNAYYKVD